MGLYVKYSLRSWWLFLSAEETVKRGSEKLSLSPLQATRGFAAHSLRQKKPPATQTLCIKKYKRQLQATDSKPLALSSFHTTHGNLWASIATRQYRKLPKPRAKTHRSDRHS